MNKRALISLAVVPIVLVGAGWWMKKSAWGRTEDNFRRDVAAMTNHCWVMPEVNYNWRPTYGYCVSLEDCKAGDFSRLMQDVHLIPPHSRFDSKQSYFDVQFVPREGSGEFSGLGVLTISIDADEGWIDFSPPLNKWNRFQLSPESCRLLKKHLWAHNARMLREIHMTPPR